MELEQLKHFLKVAVERTSQLAMVQELVGLNHGISLVPQMARELDSNERRIYRSLEGRKPMRPVVIVTNPYRYQTILQRNFIELIRRSIPPNRSRRSKSHHQR